MTSSKSSDPPRHVSEEGTRPEQLEDADSSWESVRSPNRQSVGTSEQANGHGGLLHILLSTIPGPVRNGVESVYNWWYKPSTLMSPDQSNRPSLETSSPRALKYLLSELRRRKDSIREPNVDSETIRCVQEFLSSENWAGIPSEVKDVGDAQNLVGLFLYLFAQDRLPAAQFDMKHRARRFLAILADTLPGVPEALYLNPSKTDLKEQFAISYGDFADVYLGNYDEKKVAVKRIRGVALDKDFCREALAWKTLSHKNVVPFIGIHNDQSKSFMGVASYFMPNGTLSNWRKKGNRTPAEIEHHIYEVAEGLRYLHHEEITHGNLCGVGDFSFL